MANYTITYAENLQGWTSFHSYNPQWMAGMNNDFYTFYDGKIWKHHSNSLRNNYYGTQHSSIIRTVFNVEPDMPKIFKTIKLKGKSSQSWSADVVSDLHTGNISTNGYQKKEGNWYGYIRRDNNEVDLKFLSNKAIGVVLAASIISASYVQIVVNGDVVSKLQLKSDSQDNGDLLFAADITGTTINSLGSILGQARAAEYSDVTGFTTIEMVAIGSISLSVPPTGDLLMATKNTTAESYGLRGAYMDVTLQNNESSEIELLAVAAEAFKSYQ